jgi:MFS family permease
MLKRERLISYLLILLISLTAQIPLTTLRFVIPIFAHNAGASIFIIGLLGTVYGSIYFVLASIFGKYSVKLGIKKMASIGMIIYLIISLLYTQFKTPYEYLLGKGLEAISMAMVWPAVEGLSSKLGHKDKESALLMYTFGWSIGASIAPYIASYLLVYNYFYPLYFSSIISLTSFIFIILSRPGEEGEIIENFENFSIVFNIIFPMLLYGFDSSIFYSFYSVYGAVYKFGEYGTGLVGTFYGIFQTIAFVISWLISKRVKSGKLIIIGSIMSLSVFPIYLYHTILVSIVSFSILGFGMGLVYYSALINIFRTFHKDVTSKTGIFESSIGVGYVIGPLVAGIPTKLGYILPWVVLASFSFLLLITEIVGYFYNKLI